jgi:tRNA wybutosine-synthesizing protein 1
MPEDVGISWNNISHNQWENPIHILEGAIFEQKRILSGYKAQVLQGKIEEQKYKESINPNQIAISLSGEPLFYTKLDELIRISKEKRFSVFLVTSGVLPKTLDTLKEKDAEPSRFFLSLTASNKKLYLKINRPIKTSLWEALMTTIDNVEEFRCPTVIRITLIKDVNTQKENLREFSELIKRSGCRNIEVKAYMNVGFSMRRLTENNMPSFNEVKKFSEGIGEMTGYKIRNEAPDSRVVLLSK